MSQYREKGERAHPVYKRGDWLGDITQEKVLPPSAHPGLVFERFPFIWWVKHSNAGQPEHETWNRTRQYRELKNNRWKDGEDPLDLPFLRKFCDDFTNQREHSESLLQAVHARVCRLCTILGGRSREFTAQWRFVTGMGAPHPIENGFAFDRAVGVPYLPGSSVKGVARAGAELQYDETTDGQKQEIQKGINRIFGPEGEDAKKNPHVGNVIFFDAYPVDWPKLEPDIMNPHYGDYYGKENKPPADYLQPKPIFFLTVASKTRFRFVVAPRSPEYSGDVNQAMKWLEDGLQYLGAGAKTAAGYGWFLPG